MILIYKLIISYFVSFPSEKPLNGEVSLLSDPDNEDPDGGHHHHQQLVLLGEEPPAEDLRAAQHVGAAADHHHAPGGGERHGRDVTASEVGGRFSCQALKCSGGAAVPSFVSLCRSGCIQASS